MRKIAAIISASALALGLAACSGDKPSKDEVVTAMAELGRESMGASSDLLDEDTIKKFSQCWVDGFYDDVSARTLNNLIEGNKDAKITESEETAIIEAGEACKDVVTDALMGG